MIPVEIRGANVVYTQPTDWNAERDGVVDDLHVRVVTDSEGRRLMSSAFRPTEEELAALMAGAVVVLHVFGASHPPVSVGVEV